MKVRDVKVFPVQRAPEDGPVQRSAWVRVHYDDGAFGIGEASLMQSGLASLGLIKNNLAPALIGRDPLDQAVLLETPHTDLTIGGTMNGVVTAVSRSAKHTLSKVNEDSICLRAGHGVEGDAHSGATVKHRSRILRHPFQPNQRQVHLIHAELHEELKRAGFDISPGQMGENITTRGVDLLRLPVGARLHLGEAAVVAVTGLRNPCGQLDRIQPGLMAATLERDEHGKLVRKAGIMGVVLTDGELRPGDPIRVELPPPPHQPLAPV
jgi:MOSC domain-containing protein YiiM